MLLINAIKGMILKVVRYTMDIEYLFEKVVKKKCYARCFGTLKSKFVTIAFKGSYANM